MKRKLKKIVVRKAESYVSTTLLDEVGGRIVANNPVSKTVFKVAQNYKPKSEFGELFVECVKIGAVVNAIRN